ncbi:MAG: FecR domain-containing protein [Planctomycetota bacterium]
MKPPNKLIDLYLDGTLTDEAAVELNAWIKASPQHAEAFARLTFIHRRIYENLQQQDLAQIMQQPDSVDATLNDLFATEETSNHQDALNLAALTDRVQLDRRKDSSQAISVRDLMALTGYLLRQTLRKYALSLSVSAVFVVAGLVLLFVFRSTDPAPPIAIEDAPAGPPAPAVDVIEEPQGPGEQQKGPEAQPRPQPTVVSTLTAESNAVWDRRPGIDLYAGQKLTLTQGFAEITTKRGAVAILEAPTTVEFVDSPNAIRLHAGKLVGLCETDSSKGFLVRTPHTDITDLGTCFGVDASDPSVTEVHVFDGLVAVASQISRGGAGQPVELKGGEAIRVGADQVVKERFVARDDLFESLAPRAWLALPGTGKDLAIDQVDPAWQVVSVNGQRLETPGQLKVSDVPRDFRDRLIPNDPQSSQWVRSSEVYPQASGQGDVYTVGHSFDLPEGIEPGAAWLRVRFDADDRLKQVRINGKAYTPPVNFIGDENSGLAEMTIPVTLLGEGNSAEFDVLDVVRDGGTTWFLRMDWAIRQGVTTSIGPPD